MRKTRTAIYFQKRYCLLIHSLILNQRISVSAFSANSSEKETIDRSCTFTVNQIVYINCIDVIKDGVTINDTEAVLQFNVIGDRMIKKSQIGLVRFDMNQEKIMKPESTVLFTKDLTEGKGHINYKFINLKTKTLTPEQFQLNRQRKSELQIETSRDQHSYKIQELAKFISQKDDLIQKLQKKIETLIIENRKKKDQSNEPRELSKQKSISLNVKVNTVNENIRKENEKLLQKLKQLEEKNLELEDQITDLANQKETFERQVNMYKKQIEKFQKMYESRAKSRGRTVSYINQPSFLRNSSIDPYGINQSNADWLENQQAQAPTKITVNEPSARKNSFAQQQSDLSLKNNKSISPQNAQNKMLQARASMYASSYVPSHRSQNNFGPGSLASEKDPSQAQPDQNIQNAPKQPEKVDEMALQRRISMQKQDLKWTSIIFERNQQIEILKRKLDLRVNEAKNLEKQLQKVKVQLKKKDTEIKELRKQSRRTLMFGQGSSRQLGKNRTDLELQFEKMQAEHDSEKVRLEQQIERLEKQREQLDKQNRRVKAILTDKQQRQKTTDAKYQQLKKFTQKKQEEFIQYRQKSQQYDIIHIKNKEIQGMLKTIDAKCETLQKQNKKYIEINQNLTARLRDVQRQWDRLKKSERQFEIAKNQNINYIKAIESFESRYNQLKKYCIKIESAYNKFVTAKKKGGSEAKIFFEEVKQDKEMQQKFIELSKKMEDTEINYYKQQIQDYNQEKSFLTAYFERKLRQQRDKIYDNKEIAEDKKRSIIVEKQKEIERTLHEKLQDIKSKVSKMEKTLQQVTIRINENKELNIKMIPEQLRNIDRKLSSFHEKEQERLHERRNLKQTISQLNEQLKRASSSSHLQNLQSQTLNKNVSGTGSKNQLLLSMINQNNKISQKFSMLDEARQRSQASQQRTYQQNRKMNTQLVKQNGELKLKNQKLGIDIEKIERRAQDRQKVLDNTFKKSENDFKLKIQKLTQHIEKQTAELDNLKQRYTDSQAAVAKISQEATNLSYEVEAKQEEIIKLQEKIIYFQERIQQYEKGERMMIDEVNEIKKNAEQNQNDLFALIQSRSDNFARIQKVKQTEIQKLKGIIRELEIKMEAEMLENIRCKEKIEELRANLQRVEKQTQQKLQNQRLDIENKQTAYDQLYVKQFQTSKQNEVLQEHLMEISTQIENKQLEIVEMTYELTKKSKELQVYKNQSEKFEHMQIKYKDDIKGLQLLLDDKIQQIRGFEDKYKQFQMEIQYSSKDLQRLALSNLKFETQAKQYQEKYQQKQEEIIQIKRDYSMLEVQIHKHAFEYQNVEKENNILKQHIQQLNKEIQRLNEVNSHMPLRVSRKVSNTEDNKFDCPSPGRSRRMPRKTGTLEIPQVSMIGAGGITPILSSASPNQLVRKISQNPFEPKQQIRKTRILRGTSMQGHQPIDVVKSEDEEINIIVDSPPNTKMPSKATSNVHIDFQDGQDSIRITNAPINPKQSYRQQPQPQIREETEENQQNSAGFVKNIELGDSEDYIDGNEAYEEQIRELQRQLIHSNEENQKLNTQLIQLTKKVDQLTLQVQQSPSRPPSLGVSRRRSILELPPAYPKENTQRESSQSKIQKNPNPNLGPAFETTIRRSNSGVELNQGIKGVPTGNLGQLQQQYESAQLQNQYLNNQLNTVRAELQQMTKNNERLIEQAELCRETIEQLHNRIEETNFELEQTKKFIQFQQLYNHEVELSNQLRLQIQELNAEIFAKEAHIATLMGQNGQIMEQVNQVRTQCVSTQDSKAKLENQVKQLTQTINKLKVQYRKYEQSAQLEIVKLNETVDYLKSKLKEKDEEITVLGEQFLALENQKGELASFLEQHGKNSKKNQYEQQQIESRCNQLQNQLNKTDQTRQNLYRTIKQLELQLSQKDERSKTASNQMTLIIKKYQIKLQSNQQQIQMVQSKLADKQKIITALKNQIGLYNQQCMELKTLNDELTYQSTKVEKQLKDIMVTYSTEIESYKEVISYKEKQVENLRSVVRQKENQYHNVLRNMRQIEKQKDSIQCDYIDTKNSLEKFKNLKNKESGDLYVQLQYKNSQCEKLKNTIEKMTSELESKQQMGKQESQKYESRLQAYKQKLQRYQKLLEEFQISLKKYEQRPAFEAHEEVLFENELLKNRIDELQEQLQNKNNAKDKQQAIYMEFRKYKANKERQIQDLNSEMDKYSLTINELQENVFFLKRQNDSLKRQNRTINDSKEELSLQCEDLRESLHEVEKQLQFYKKRKLLDMQKLLNDTQ